MKLLDRLRRKASEVAPPVVKEQVRAARARSAAKSSTRQRPTDEPQELRLRERLHDDPNDVSAFHQLADIVRRRAAEHQEPGGDPQRAADDAVWALAEELARSSHAWHPLIELARLSIHDDRDGAMRRLQTAAERDPGGIGLAQGLEVLRAADMPDEALGLGVGHWRPREHDLEAGRQLVGAAVEAGRLGEARRHLEALAQHPDRGRADQLRRELERSIAEADERRRAANPFSTR